MANRLYLVFVGFVLGAVFSRLMLIANHVNPAPTTTYQLRYPYHDVLNLGSQCPKEGCGDQRILGGGEGG